MSTLKVNNLQVGQHATATNNFTLYQPAVPDGTVRLGYGNVGSVTDSLTFTNTGRLGIGVTNPIDKLEVSSGRIAVSSDTTTPTTGQAFFYKQAIGAIVSGYGVGLETGGAGSRTTTLYATYDGKVGIGTTNPGEKLYVNGGNVLTTGRFRFGGSIEGGARSLAAGSGATIVDTGITINATTGGGTMLVLACRNTSNGTSTQSAVYMLQFYYDGDNTPTKTLISGSDIMAINKSATNTLTVTCGAGNWAVTAFVCGFNIT